MLGPGKGMYSRLYRNVLAYYPEVESALATNISYNDAGVFVLQGSSSPRAVSMVLYSMVSRFEIVNSPLM